MDHTWTLNREHDGIEDDSSRRPDGGRGKRRSPVSTGEEDRLFHVGEEACAESCWEVGESDANCFRARIFARPTPRICQVPKNAKLVAKLLEAIFFFICQKMKDAKLLEMLGGILFGPSVQFSFGTLLAGQLMNKNVCLKILDRYLGGPQIWT